MSDNNNKKNMNRAIASIKEAASKYPKVKEATERVKRKTGIKKIEDSKWGKRAAKMAAIAAAATTGRISTPEIKIGKSGKLRGEYDDKKKAISAKLSWKFD